MLQKGSQVVRSNRHVQVTDAHVSASDWYRHSDVFANYFDTRRVIAQQQAPRDSGRFGLRRRVQKCLAVRVAFGEAAERSFPRHALEQERRGLDETVVSRIKDRASTCRAALGTKEKAQDLVTAIKGALQGSWGTLQSRQRAGLRYEQKLRVQGAVNDCRVLLVSCARDECASYTGLS